MSLQSELQSRIARRQNAIKALEYLYSWYAYEGDRLQAAHYKEILQANRAEQYLDKRLMRNVPWGDVYYLVGFNRRDI